MIAFYAKTINNIDDKEQFQNLYNKYNKNMLAVANYILKSNALAEEAVQQSWLNIINNFDKVSKIPQDSVGGYIITTVKNVSYNIYKKEHFCEPLEESFLENKAVTYNEDTSQFEYLVEIIRALPLKYRQILELKFVMEWKNEDIAKYLNMNVSTVSTRIQRGRNLLINILKEEGIINKKD
ncbi:MAG: sigma-70 family RNA polymerase sigma factor [Firmicutes bacterium]|nr:sigma-70 family RNA polymerase sigma factor [Bacillota bacterium]